MECIEKIIKKDMIDPTNGKKMTDKDIITLQRVCIPSCKCQMTKQNNHTISQLIYVLNTV